MNQPRTLDILLIEDEAMVRSLLVRHFRQQGHQVIEASNGDQGLALYRKAPHGYDIVVTDIHLPGVTGLDLAVSIRELRPAQPIVFITGDVDEKLARRALEHAGAGYLLKPFEFFQLDGAIEEAVSRAPARDLTPAAAVAGGVGEPEWRIQQRRLLEAAARQPINLRLRAAPRRRRQLPLLLAAATVVLVLVAWAVGSMMGSERPPESTIEPAADEKEGRMIYVPATTPERDRSSK